MAISRCPYCHAIIDENDKYCNNCGTQLLFPDDESIEEEIPGEKIIDAETEDKDYSLDEPEDFESRVEDDEDGSDLTPTSELESMLGDDLGTPDFDTVLGGEGTGRAGRGEEEAEDVILVDEAPAGEIPPSVSGPTPDFPAPADSGGAEAGAREEGTTAVVERGEPADEPEPEAAEEPEVRADEGFPPPVRPWAELSPFLAPGAEPARDAQAEQEMPPVDTPDLAGPAESGLEPPAEEMEGTPGVFEDRPSPGEAEARMEAGTTGEDIPSPAEAPATEAAAGAEPVPAEGPAEPETGAEPQAFAETPEADFGDLGGPVEETRAEEDIPPFDVSALGPAESDLDHPAEEDERTKDVPENRPSAEEPEPEARPGLEALGGGEVPSPAEAPATEAAAGAESVPAGGPAEPETGAESQAFVETPEAEPEPAAEAPPSSAGGKEEPEPVTFDTHELEELGKTVDLSGARLDGMIEDLAGEDTETEPPAPPAEKKTGTLPPWADSLRGELPQEAGPRHVHEDSAFVAARDGEEDRDSGEEDPGPGRPDTDEEFDEGEQEIFPRRRPSDSGLGYPERLTQADLPFGSAEAEEEEGVAEGAAEEEPVAPPDVREPPASLMSEPRSGEAVGAPAEPAPRTEPAGERPSRLERARAEDREERLRPPFRLLPFLKARLFDVLFLGFVWLVALWLASRSMRTPLIDLMSAASGAAILLYAALLVLYFFLFKFFLGETLGDRFFREPDRADQP